MVGLPAQGHLELLLHGLRELGLGRPGGRIHECEELADSPVLALQFAVLHLVRGLRFDDGRGITNQDLGTRFVDRVEAGIVLDAAFGLEREGLHQPGHALAGHIADEAHVAIGAQPPDPGGGSAPFGCWFAEQEFVRDEVALAGEPSCPGADGQGGPGDDRACLGAVRARLLGGRHQAVANLIAQPEQSWPVLRRIAGKIIETKVARLLLNTMTFEAMRCQEGPHNLGERRLVGRCGPGQEAHAGDHARNQHSPRIRHAVHPFDELNNGCCVDGAAALRIPQRRRPSFAPKRRTWC